MAWAPDYVTPAEVTSYLRIEDTADDVLAAVWASTASRAVDGFCARQFGQVGALEDREYAGTWDRHLGSYVYQIDDLQSIASMLVLDADANEVTTYTLGPTNALRKGRPYERLYASVCGPLVIQAMWGWTAVPVPVKQAALLQAARLAKRRDAPFGIAGSPSEGTEVRLLAQLDPDLRTSLVSYQRKWWAA